MVYGYRRGCGGGGGGGFGFRGASPSWPYIGRGRGGLPRCAYPNGAVTPYPPVSANNFGRFNQGQDVTLLKSQTDAIKAEIKRLEDEISEIEKAK